MDAFAGLRARQWQPASSVGGAVCLPGAARGGGLDLNCGRPPGQQLDMANVRLLGKLGVQAVSQGTVGLDGQADLRGLMVQRDIEGADDQRLLLEELNQLQEYAGMRCGGDLVGPVHGRFLGLEGERVRKREKPPELSRWRLRISEEESEGYGAPRTILGEVMTGRDFMPQARHAIG